MLEVDAIEVNYGRVPAVSGLSLNVGKGEAVALIGHNGAGKSTTLRAIAGALNPVRGQIRLNGERINGKSPELVSRMGMALIPEGRRIFGRLTVSENLLIGSAGTKQSASEVEGRMEEMVERFPVLGDYFSSLAGNLSGGEQQQLAIARALMSQPTIMLLDEPSLGLSPIMSDRVYEDLGRLREQGITMLVVEQNASRLAELVDRAYVIRSGGQVVLECPVEQLESEDIGAHLGFQRSGAEAA